MIKIYKNGNYHVIIDLDNGTKYRYLSEGETKYMPAFPETMDVNITNKCSNGCSFCYQNCTPEGKHCNFNYYHKLLKKLHPYTELAINGNNLDHPQLEGFLFSCSKKNVIVNMTVNLKDFVNNYNIIYGYMKAGFIKGLGISVSNSKEDKQIILSRKIEAYLKHDEKFCNNIVFHIINGLYDKILIDNLRYSTNGHNLKILVLGYKHCGRGKNITDERYNDIIESGKKNLDYVLKKADIVSFDNLAIEQLDLFNSENEDIRKQIGTSYLGNDGFASMYLDLVDGYWTKSSYDKEFPKYSITKLLQNQDNPFEIMLRKIHSYK